MDHYGDLPAFGGGGAYPEIRKADQSREPSGRSMPRQQRFSVFYVRCEQHSEDDCETGGVEDSASI